MKRGSAVRMFLISCLALFAGKTSYARPDDAVKVEVYAKHHSSKIVYTYRVVNNTQDTINAITVGRDSLNDDDPANDVWELQELPSGWSAKLGIPAASSDAPTGWRVSLKGPETGDTHAIVWETSNDKTPALLGGQTTARMSVSLDQADNKYLLGHAMVHFDKRLPDTLTVPMGQLDIEPPTLAVTLDPATVAPSGKLVPVNAIFTIKTDYYDHFPEIKLESIAANEPLASDDISDASLGIDDRYIKLRASAGDDMDRIYTVTYSATDGSGNQTLASATVTVPHSRPAVAQP
ncbi:MAG: hypothetical protein WA632_03550 [Gallionella sp.]